jgi:hypothetical protein
VARNNEKKLTKKKKKKMKTKKKLALAWRWLSPWQVLDVLH